MAIRLISGLLLLVTAASTGSAQFFGVGPAGSFGPGGFMGPGYPPDRISIRSPFFRMELRPYGGSYSSPYSSFSARGPGLAPPPLPYPGISPRGWRSPRFEYEPRGNALMPNSRPELNPTRPSPPRYAEPSREIGPQDEFDPNDGFPLPGQSVLEPAPVPPPQYEIPSFSEVFPNEVDDNVLSSATRIVNRLQRGVARLTANLGQRESGDVWHEYLRLPDVRQFAANLAQTQGARPSLADQDQITDQARELALNFDAVVANPELNWLQAAPGFDDIRITLNAIGNVATPDSQFDTATPSSQSPSFMDSPTLDPQPDAPNQDQFEDLPAPPAKPDRKKGRPVFRAEI